jgi:hypothetical protein
LKQTQQTWSAIAKDSDAPEIQPAEYGGTMRGDPAIAMEETFPHID